MTIKWQYHQYSYIIYKDFYMFLFCARGQNVRVLVESESKRKDCFEDCSFCRSCFVFCCHRRFWCKGGTRCTFQVLHGWDARVCPECLVAKVWVCLPKWWWSFVSCCLCFCRISTGQPSTPSYCWCKTVQVQREVGQVWSDNITYLHNAICISKRRLEQPFKMFIFFSHAMFPLMFWGMDGSYMHYMAVEGVRAENVSAKELGSFALWALCGYWSGPKRINYQTEPDPDDVQDIAEAFVELLAKRSIDTLQELADELAQCDPWELVEEAANVEEQPKLARRLHAGLLELQSADISDVEEMLQSSVTTCDETKMAQLVREVEEMAPALSRVRCNAIDAGLYWWCSLELQWFETCLFGALWGLRRKETSGMVRQTPGGKMEHLQFNLVLLSRPCVSCFLQARAATEDLETYTKAYEARSIGWPNASKAQGCAANYCKKN